MLAGIGANGFVSNTTAAKVFANGSANGTIGPASGTIGAIGLPMEQLALPILTLAVPMLLYPAGTQHQNDVVSTSMRRDHVASTLIRRHFNFVCHWVGCRKTVQGSLVANGTSDYKWHQW